MLELVADKKRLAQCISASHDCNARALTPTLSLAVSLADALEAFKGQSDVLLGKTPCQFYAHGRLIFTGYIDKIEVKSESLTAKLALRSATGLLIDSHMNLPQGKAQMSIASIVGNIAGYFGIAVRDESQGQMQAKAWFRYESHEKAFDALRRYGKKSGVYFSTDEMGRLVAHSLQAEQQTHTLQNYTSLSVSQNNAKLYGVYQVKTTGWQLTYAKEDKAEEKDSDANGKKMHIATSEETGENAENMAKQNRETARRESLTAQIKTSPIQYEITPYAKVKIENIAGQNAFVVESVGKKWNAESEEMRITLAPNAGNGRLYSFVDFLAGNRLIFNNHPVKHETSMEKL